MPYKNQEDRKANSKAYYQRKKQEISARNKENPDHLRRALEWNAANPEKVKIGKRKLICKKHGITLEQYDQALRDQNGVCAICKRPESGKRNRSLSIDHDHNHCPGETGCGVCFRGLLCARCNLGIGHFGDDRYALQQAIEYITQRSINVEF